MGVQAVLTIILLVVATVKAQDVTFWRTTFTMTCPQNGDWFKNEDSRLNVSTSYTEEYNSETRGLYYCKYKDENDKEEKYYFYVKGKVCENCFEVDTLVFGLSIALDMVVTTLLMMVIYRYTKKKVPAAPTRSSTAPTRSGGRAPPVPSPDYEPLNTRTKDIYAMMNRTG
ncbi:T-cell surface glycoprotein CD3 epsilon chain-like isoform X2 [Toxotes jaculatrix]|uniref:T-cell surface glycoprotein CD3 epsilon chain-like isoform X2 n=1 Tax=Toxotes jaculatrix TaxID=941984 RepID=UPI001B3AB127|nr:T-cell surface glycoprotein CD3 epsilon chain-like isoform X2 [Toxotes jaculatrix]